MEITQSNSKSLSALQKTVKEYEFEIRNLKTLIEELYGQLEDADGERKNDKLVIRSYKEDQQERFQELLSLKRKLEILTNQSKADQERYESTIAKLERENKLFRKLYKNLLALGN